MANKKLKKGEELTLGKVGFAMKAETHRTPGETIIVSKKLWVEIADLLMQTDRNLKQIEHTLDGFMGRVAKNGK